MSITINSPEGSGNIFAKTALANINSSVNVIHNYKLLNSGGNNIFILRNPYDCILSSIELPFIRNRYLPQQFNIDDDKTNQEINMQIEKYLNYLNNYKNKKVYAVTFEFLTNNPKQFVENVTLKFDKKIDKDNLDLISEEYVIKALIEKNPHRAPFRDDNSRQKTSIREIIKESLNQDKRMQDLYPIYLQHKNILQSTKNMVQ
jgi:hypothetical protein